MLNILIVGCLVLGHGRRHRVGCRHGDDDSRDGGRVLLPRASLFKLLRQRFFHNEMSTLIMFTHRS